MAACSGVILLDVSRPARIVARDKTVAIRDQWWQLDKSRWRHTLAGQTVTIHRHLNGTVSIRYGPSGHFEMRS
jgi:hypothetical protein